MRPDFTGHAALMAATDGYPLARQLEEPITGFRDDAVVMWVGQSRHGPVVQSLGNGPAAVRLYSRLAATAVMRGVSSVHLPRVTDAKPIEFHSSNDWSYLWTHEASPSPERPVALGPEHHPAIASILDDVLSYTGNRPASPDIRQWWGLFDGDRLVAVAADRSRRGVGYLAGVAVARSHHGKGFGSRLAGALMAPLVAEFGVCALGVMAHNTRALALWERLGFGHRADITSLRLNPRG